MLKQISEKHHISLIKNYKSSFYCTEWMDMNSYMTESSSVATSAQKRGWYENVPGHSISTKSDKNTLFSVKKYKVNITVFWDVSSCSLVRDLKYLAEFSRLHLQGALFYNEYRCSRFLRKAGNFIPDYAAPHSRRQYSPYLSPWKTLTLQEMTTAMEVRPLFVLVFEYKLFLKELHIIPLESSRT